jgi:hypothetical protein
MKSTKSNMDFRIVGEFIDFLRSFNRVDCYRLLVFASLDLT